MIKPMSYGEALAAVAARDERIAALETKIAALEPEIAARDERIAALEAEHEDLQQTSTVRRLGQILARIEAGDIKQAVAALQSLGDLYSPSVCIDPGGTKPDGSPVGPWSRRHEARRLASRAVG